MKDRRLYLFDIDGTLVATGGAGSSAMRSAFTALWGLDDGFQGIEFSGRTDRAILRDALAAARLEVGAFEPALGRFKRAYFRRLLPMLHERQGRVLPGVVELLSRLGRDDRATVALGTGNFRTSAAIKLRYFGIESHFRGGGFGDQTEDRASLIAQAIRAANRAAGRHASVFVIGDTQHDVAAAKANGVVAVGVATGTVGPTELARAGADYVLDSLTDAAAFLPASPD